MKRQKKIKIKAVLKKRTALLLPEIEKVFRCNIEDFAELEDNIERNSDITEFNSADMASVNVCKFR